VLASLALVALLAPASARAVNPVTFSPVGNLSVKREFPGAARLNDGRVLVVGGYNNADGALDSAELFDPKTNTFSPLGATLAVRRYAPAVARLPDGRILVAGGWNITDNDLASADVFNPSTNSFSAVGSLAVPREEAAAAPLPDGRVLVAGGYSNTGAVNSTEIFNPQTNTFSPGPTVPVAAFGSAAAAVSGGRILVAGGRDDTLPVPQFNVAFVLNSAGNSFSAVGSLATRRYGPAGASLPQGRALIAAGDPDGNSDHYLASAEIFDPTTNTFSSAGVGNLPTKLREAAGASLADGRALVAGGWDGTDALAIAEVLSVPSNAFKAKLKGRKVIFSVTNEGVAQVTDVSTKVATTAKKKKPKLVKTKSKHGGPGKIKVKVKLTKQGSAQLAAKGKLRIRVVYTPDQGISATKKLKLRD
jgi:hypothetical protein